MTVHLGAWLAAALVLGAPAAAAQDSVALAPGTPVRLWTRPLDARRAPGPPQHAGAFVGLRGDTLLLRPAGRGVLALPRAQLTGLEARLPARNTALGAGLGLLAGAAGGALSVRLDDADCSADVCGSTTRSQRRVERALAYGAAGALVGGALGWRIRTPRWRSLMPRR